MTKTKHYIKFPDEEEVERLLKTWDIVRCTNCKRKISMLRASIVIINGKEAFVCKKGCKNV